MQKSLKVTPTRFERHTERFSTRGGPLDVDVVPPGAADGEEPPHPASSRSVPTTDAVAAARRRFAFMGVPPAPPTRARIGPTLAAAPTRYQ